MSILIVLRKNFFLAIFFTVGLCYAYFNYHDNTSVTFYLKPLVILSLLLQYFAVKTKKYNVFFISAFVFALIGDILFNFNNKSIQVLALGSFLLFLLFILIVISHSAKELKLNNLLLASVPFLIVLIFILNYFFDFDNAMSGIYFILGIVVAILCSFSFYFYLKQRDKKSLYYFIGCLLFIVTSFTRMMNEFYGFTTIMKLVNNTTYMLSLFYLYLGAITHLKEKNSLKTTKF